MKMTPTKRWNLYKGAQIILAVLWIIVIIISDDALVSGLATLGVIITYFVLGFVICGKSPWHPWYKKHGSKPEKVINSSYTTRGEKRAAKFFLSMKNWTEASPRNARVWEVFFIALTTLGVVVLVTVMLVDWFLG